jgi:hypothetical protein
MLLSAPSSFEFSRKTSPSTHGERFAIRLSRREPVRFLARKSLLMVDEIGCLPIGINSRQSVLPLHQCLLRAL